MAKGGDAAIGAAFNAVRFGTAPEGKVTLPLGPEESGQTVEPTNGLGKIGPKLERKANPAGRATVVEVGNVGVAGLDERGYIGFKILRLELESELRNAKMLEGRDI